MALDTPDDSNLSFEDSLTLRMFENEVGVSLSDCSKEDLKKIIVQLKRENGLLREAAKESLLSGMRPAPTVDERLPDTPNVKLGVFTDLLVEWLEAQPEGKKVYRGGKSYSPSSIAKEIKDQELEGLEWLNFAISGSIDLISENQLEPFSEEDSNLVDLILRNESKISLYTSVKVLKRLIDKLSSSAFLSNRKISNEVFTENESFMSLLKAIYLYCFD